jgi:hypothetical protein
MGVMRESLAHGGFTVRDADRDARAIPRVSGSFVFATRQSGEGNFVRPVREVVMQVRRLRA